jgi:hypothetical protein
MMLLALLALALQHDESLPEETVVIECPGLRCAACQLSVLRGPNGVPGVRSVDFDETRSWLIVRVDPGFDRHTELVVRVQRAADPIEMFRARLLRPRQVFLYVDRPLDAERGAALARALRSVRGVKSVTLDPREVFSIAIDDDTDQTRLLGCVAAFGCRGELFETRYGANLASRFSELSHHAIGVMILLLSFLLLAEKSGHGPRWLGRVIPALWILGGGLLVLFSDPDSWPYQRGLADSFTDKMIVQHKILAVGMIVLGIAEARARKNRGWKYAPVTLFLVVAALSGFMLQYHFPNMVDPGHLAAWEIVNRQHLVAAVVGGLALGARALSDYRLVRAPRFGYVWPVLLGLEGVLLCVFSEPVW